MKRSFLLLAILSLSGCAVLGTWVWPLPRSATDSAVDSEGKKTLSLLYPAKRITRVILRAAHADRAVTISDMSTPSVEVAGVPTGGAQGYHSPDPNWRETPAERWGLGFEAARFGSTLVISTKNELAYIHHYYALESLKIRVPVGVEVVRQKRQLTGDGGADMSRP
jgi:hypothetical protein